MAPIVLAVLLGGAIASPSSFYYWYGQRVPLVESPAFLAVELTTESGEIDTQVTSFGARVVERLAPQGRPIAIVDVERLSDAQRRGLLKAVQQLPTFKALLKPLRSRGAQGDLDEIIDRFVLVRFAPPLSPLAAAALGEKWGFSIERSFGFAAGTYRLEARDVERSVALSHDLVESRIAAFAEPDRLVRPRLYQVMDDLLAEQWHIPAAHGLGADDVWAAGTLGDAATVIAVADTGVETTHPELSMAGKLVDSSLWLDVFDGDTDPNPPSGDTMEDIVGTHGTACAGLAAAPANAGGSSTGGIVGVCPGCSLLPIRLGPGSGMWAVGTLATAFDHVRTNDVAVMSNSWGLGTIYLPQAVYEAMEAAITAGVSIFFASGNGAGTMAPRDLASHPGVIAIGGSSSADDHISYSDVGDALNLVAPTMEIDTSSMLGCPTGPGITTTDLTGDRGLNPQNDSLMEMLCSVDALSDTAYTSLFSGTSAACPIAAGAGGLLRSAHPELTPELVRWAFTQSADKIGSAEYDAAGWNREMGFGRINLVAAIAQAEIACTAEPESAACEDSLDNDCDGLVDAADPDCGLEYPPALDLSRWGDDCTPSSYGEDEASCGLDLGCVLVGEPSMMGGGDGLCGLMCEDECPSGFLCAAITDATTGVAYGYCMRACSSTAECPSGFRCATSDHLTNPDAGVCLSSCTGNSDCHAGLACNATIDVCGGDALVGGPQDDGASLPDGGPQDDGASLPDGGPQDDGASLPDGGPQTGSPPARKAESGCGCSTTGSGMALASLLLFLRRRRVR